MRRVAAILLTGIGVVLGIALLMAVIWGWFELCVLVTDSNFARMALALGVPMFAVGCFVGYKATE